MIPKKIHYCWFGGKELPDSVKKCIASWKKFFPDFEIVEWNEQNFDINCCNYVKEAYKEKKWAFVSDYARLKILYENGGVYFDTDVEVIKSFDDILKNGNFMGQENSNADLDDDICVNVGIGFAMEPYHKFLKEVLDDYEKSSFYNSNGSLNLYTIVDRVTNLLKPYGLEKTDKIQNVLGINIYPIEYFCPLNYQTKELKISENTHSIHWFDASWIDAKMIRKAKLIKILKKIIGKKNIERIKKMIKK